MTIGIQTEEQKAAAAELAKLETAAQTAKAALREHDTNQNPKYPSPDANARRIKLESEAATANRALQAAHNEALYADILDGMQKNMAKQAAEKAAQAAQQANESEAQFKEKALQAYLAAGGTNVGFAGEWQSIRAELVRQKTISALTQAQPTGFVDQYIAARNSQK